MLNGYDAEKVDDKDYYGNPDNDGHIMFAFYNIKDEDIFDEIPKFLVRFFAFWYIGVLFY